MYGSLLPTVYRGKVVHNEDFPFEDKLFICSRLFICLYVCECVGCDGWQGEANIESIHCNGDCTEGNEAIRADYWERHRHTYTVRKVATAQSKTE